MNIVLKKKIPDVPELDEILDLLTSTHMPGVPNWTSEQKFKAYNFLESLSLQYYRREKIIQDK